MKLYWKLVGISIFFSISVYSLTLANWNRIFWFILTQKCRPLRENTDSWKTCPSHVLCLHCWPSFVDKGGVLSWGIKVLERSSPLTLKPTWNNIVTPGGPGTWRRPRGDRWGGRRGVMVDSTCFRITLWLDHVCSYHNTPRSVFYSWYSLRI